MNILHTTVREAKIILYEIMCRYSFHLYFSLITSLLYFQREYRNISIRVTLYTNHFGVLSH
jgi:hypothetical protein